MGLIGLVMVGELLPRTPLVDARFLPPFSQMAAALLQLLSNPEFWEALISTLHGWSLGLLIAAAAGLVLGITIGGSRRLTAATFSTIEFMRPIPSVALIPLAVLLFGSDMRSTLLLVIYASFWQVLIQTISGVQDVDPVARDTARSYQLGVATELRRVVWPTALPYVITGLRLAAAVALILEVTGELIIGSPGLGRQIAVAKNSGAVDLMYALIIVTGVLGLSVNAIARRLERRVLHWHPSVRGETPQ